MESWITMMLFVSISLNAFSNIVVSYLPLDQQSSSSTAEDRKNLSTYVDGCEIHRRKSPLHNILIVDVIAQVCILEGYLGQIITSQYRR